MNRVLPVSWSVSLECGYGSEPSGRPLVVHLVFSAKSERFRGQRPLGRGETGQFDCN